MLRAQAGPLLALTLVVSASVERAAAEGADLEQRLVAAVGIADPAALERAARRLGVGGLLRALRSEKRAVVQAAIEAAPLVDKGWLLLDALLDLVRRPGAERALAAQAASALVHVAEETRPPDLALNEDIPPVIARSARGLVAAARDPHLALDVRVQVLLALAHLTDVVELPAELVLPLLADSEPRLREVAVEVLVAGAPWPVEKELARLVREEQAVSVARAAAAALCARVALQGGAGTPELAALRAARAEARLRELAESLDARDDQLVDIARCLVRLGSAADRNALDGVRRRSPRLRRLLRRLR